MERRPFGRDTSFGRDTPFGRDRDAPAGRDSGDGPGTALVLVTGARGKTSVARLLVAADAASRAGDGHGSSPPERALRAPRAPRLRVLELSPGRPAQAPDATADLLVLTGLDGVGGLGAGPSALLQRAERWVLNADCALCRAHARGADRPITWFTLDPRNPLVLDHLGRGGDACLFDDGALVLGAGGTRAPVVSARAVPSTLGGAARHQVANALAALGAAVGLGLSLAAVRAGLAAVEAGSLFQLGGAQVLVDRPPDRAAAEALLRTAAELPAERRRVLFLRDEAARSPALAEAARLAGLEVLPPGDLRAVLADCAPGDLLLVLAPDGARPEDELLRPAQAAGWRPGAPLPRR